MQMKSRKTVVSIIGLGYVGLCTAVTFASRGIKIIGIDVDRKRVEQLQKGEAPIYEPKLDGMLKIAVKKGLFQASDDISLVSSSGVIFLTVGTPSQGDGSIDLTFIKNATDSLGKSLRQDDDYHVVVVKSTVVPGTTNNVVRPSLEDSSRKKIGKELGLCANPEFLREGTAIEDALNPDKIVIGSNDKKSTEELTKLYRRFYGSRRSSLFTMSPEAAELVKYASNAFLATKVSFINTIANIAERTSGVDVGVIADAIGSDPRIGKLFLKAGPGYGGSCFHKDLQALINYSQRRGYDPLLLHATEEINENQAMRVVEIAEELLGSLLEKRVSVLGLAFKRDTDDIREAPSLRVIEKLKQRGAQVVAYDPMAMPNTKAKLGDSIDYARNILGAIEGTDCAVIMTEWDAIRKLKAKDFKEYMRSPNVVDARKVYDPKAFSQIRYAAVGLGPLVPDCE